MWRKTFKLVSSNYSLLLTLLFLLFVTRPFTYGHIYTEVWQTCLTLSLLIAVYHCAHQRVVKIITCSLAIPVLFLSWLNLFILDPPQYLITTIATGIYTVLCTGSIIYDVLLRAKVTLETLRGVVCAYFLIAFIFCYTFVIIALFEPGSFSISGEVITDVLHHPHFFSNMLYFSFIILLTIGFGDIVAVDEPGQTAVVLEGIIGQLYLAIFVARIVSVYTLYSNQTKQIAKPEEEN